MAALSTRTVIVDAVAARALLPAATAWAAALLATNLTAWPLALVGWGAAAAALWAALVLRRRAALPRALSPLPLLALCLSVLALVSTAAAVQAPQRQPSFLLDAAEDGSLVTLRGVVMSTPERQPSPFAFVGGGDVQRVRFALRAESTQLGREPPARLSGVPMQLFAELATEAVPPEIGSGVRVTARLQANAPGEPSAFLAYGTDPLVVEAPPPWYLAWAVALRTDFRAAAARLPGDGGALLPGLAIGDTSAVGIELDAAMTASSLSHLTAVSGANCAVVIAAVMLLGAALRLSRRLRVALSLSALLGFIVLVTPEPSVLRAGLMAVIVLLGLASGRPGGGVPALGAAVIVLLTLDPWLAASYGFALSVLATIGLLLLTAPLAAALGRWMPRGIALGLAIPLAAQLACQPVLVLLSPSVPLLGVPANLLAGPAAPIATLLGLLACLLLPILPSLGFAVAQIAWLPAAFIAAVARTVAGMPGARAPWLDGMLGALLLGAATAIALWLLRHRPGRSGRDSASTVFATAALLALAGAYGGMLLGTAVRAFSRPADWQIALCDVGQGDAVLVRDAGRIALIDTGPEPEALRNCLGELGVGHIDLLVLTHYDRDHIGGLSAVLGAVDAAIVGRSTGSRDDAVLEPLLRAGVSVHLAARGDRGTLGGLRWRVLWPAEQEGELSTGNPGSVVLETEGGGIRALFLADLGEESERALLELERPGPVDVVKVAHHGSSDQHGALYERLAARVGLIGVGADNGYGHPSATLLAMLRQSNTRGYRSDRNGLVLVSPGGTGNGALRVWAERGGD